MKKNRILRRKRVIDVLEQTMSYPLTILSATMGYGKTTVIRDFLSQKSTRSIWLSLVGYDGDESIFWEKLCKAFCKISPEFGEKLERIGFPVDSRQNSAVLELFYLLGQEETVFVIDDYHLVDHLSPLGTLMELVAEEEIPNFHMILLTRTRPRFHLLNLIAKDLCCYLDTDLLSFTFDEMKEYFHFMELHILPEEIERIYHYTEGWISAIYLMLLGVQKGVPVSEVSDIEQLVSDNLFSQMEESLQQLLISLSVLDQFTLQQASEITQNHAAPVMLKKLVEQNAFVDFDRQAGIYKLHNVLLDFLRSKVDMEGIDLREVCWRAGRWFLDQKDIISAFEYYFRGQHLQELLAEINERRTVGCWYVGIDLLSKIYQAIPTDWYLQYPYPMLHFARSFLLRGKKEDGQKIGKIISVLEKKYSQHQGVSEKQQNQILGEIEIIKIFLAFNDAEKMVILSRNAKELMGEEVSAIILRENEFSFGVPHLLHTYFRQPGTFRQTLTWIEKGFPPQVFDGCGTGCELVAVAEYGLETGDYNNCRLFADKAIYKAKTMGQTGIILCARFAMMRLYLLEGNFADAKAIIAQMRNLLFDLREKINIQNTVIYNSTIDICEGFLFGCLNTPDLIPAWLRDGNFSSRVLMLQGLGYPSLIHEKAVLLAGDWIALEVLCENFVSENRVFHNQLGLIHNGIYAAVAKEHLYGMEMGAAALLAVLYEAQMDGICLPFAENARFLLPMLYEIREMEKLDKVYLEAVIGLCEQYHTKLQQQQNASVQLTTREREVLCLLAQGLTQREMADRLFLSVSSIKKYLENIYGKFEVNNKVRAVQKAQDAGFL